MEEKSFDFAKAFYHMFAGKKIRRLSWLDKTQYICTDLVSFSDSDLKTVIIQKNLPDRTKKNKAIYWEPNQADILASDWVEAQLYCYYMTDDHRFITLPLEFKYAEPKLRQAIKENGEHGMFCQTVHLAKCHINVSGDIEEFILKVKNYYKTYLE